MYICMYICTYNVQVKEYVHRVSTRARARKYQFVLKLERYFTHTNTDIYLYTWVRMCVCVYVNRGSIEHACVHEFNIYYGVAEVVELVCKGNRGSKLKHEEWKERWVACLFHFFPIPKEIRAKLYSGMT